MEEMIMSTGVMEPTFKTKKLNMKTLPVLAKQQIDAAKLPELYVRAKLALKECAHVDEIKDIQDKHSAIAHYAKQAKDTSLLYYAERIQLRAFMRMGALVSELPGTATEIAKEHGIACNVQNWAKKAQHLPIKVVDQLIDQQKPPSKKKLADHAEGYMTPEQLGYNPNYQHTNFNVHRRKEAEIKPNAHDRAVELVAYLVSVKEDLEYYLTDKCGGTHTMKELAEALVPEEDLLTDYHCKILAPITDMLNDFRTHFPEK
jgi:hypothetical protein